MSCTIFQEGPRANQVPMATVVGPDNPSPAIHHMTQLHDWDISSVSLRFATDFLDIPRLRGVPWLDR